MFSIFITYRKKKKEQEAVNSLAVYNSLYQYLCRIDDEDYSDNNTCLVDYFNLCTIFSYWLFGKDRRCLDEDDIHSITVYSHPKVLPLFLHTLRYSNEPDKILQHLINFKIYLTEDNTRKTKSLLIEQCIMKEIILLFIRFENDVVMNSVIRDCLCILLNNAIDEKGFIDTISYFVTFALYRMEDSGFGFVSQVIQDLVVRISCIDASVLSRNLTNLSFLLSVLIDLHHIQQQTVTSGLHREAALSELEIDHVSHFSTQLKTVTVEGEDDQLSSLSNLLSNFPHSIKCIESIQALMETFEDLPLILIHSSRIYDLLYVLVLMLLNNETDPNAVQLVIAIARQILSRVKENNQQYQVFAYLLYWSLYHVFTTQESLRELIKPVFSEPIFKSLIKVVLILTTNH